MINRSRFHPCTVIWKQHFCRNFVPRKLFWRETGHTNRAGNPTTETYPWQKIGCGIAMQLGEDVAKDGNKEKWVDFWKKFTNIVK